MVFGYTSSMNQPQVYMWPPSLTPSLPPSSPSHSSDCPRPCFMHHTWTGHPFLLLFLLSSIRDTPDLLVCFITSLRIGHFSKETCLFLLENSIKNQGLGFSLCCYHRVSLFVGPPLSAEMPWKLSVYINLYICTCLQACLSVKLCVRIQSKTRIGTDLSNCKILSHGSF